MNLGPIPVNPSFTTLFYFVSLARRPRMASSRQLVLVSFLGALGTTVDFYDFFVSGTAASLAWPTVFFATASPAAALVFSYSAFVISYFARPFGGFVFGHFGDTRGRQKVLVWTLLTMGLGTLGIGLIPSSASIGVTSI